MKWYTFAYGYAKMGQKLLLQKILAQMSTRSAPAATQMCVQFNIPKETGFLHLIVRWSTPRAFIIPYSFVMHLDNVAL